MEVAAGQQRGTRYSIKRNNEERLATAPVTDYNKLRPETLQFELRQPMIPSNSQTMSRLFTPCVAGTLFLLGLGWQATAQDLTLDGLFPVDRVLDVEITLAEQDWDTIRRQSRNLFEVLHEKRRFEPIESPYTYVDARVTIDGVVFPKVGIRKKGFIGSQSSTRPSLKIKLNHIDEKGSIDGLTNLTFNNNKQDPTLVSQFMGYALFNAAGSPAPRSAFANVSVNGKHLGVYTHVETMRKPLFKREFGNENGILYEGTVVDFYEGWEGSFEKKFGKDKTGRKQIEKLIKAIQEQPGGSEVGRAIGELVDLDSFYTYWAIEGLIGFWDGYSGNNNNFFVYLNPGTGKFHFLPWGADAVFDKYSKLGYDPNAPISVKTKGIVAHKLYQLDSGRERYARTLLGLLENHWDEKALLAETDRIETMLKPHLAASQANLGQALEKVREFIRSRRADIVAEISNGMPIWARVPKPPPVIPANFVRGNDADSIWYAAKTGNLDGITARLEQGTDVDTRDRSGATALSLAALAGQSEAVKLLIATGADIDAKNNEGNSALHGAAFLGQLDVVKVFGENNANVNIRNNRGETPLDSAAAEWSEEIQGFVEFIATFLHVDVDLEIVKAGRPQVAALLREYGGKRGSDLPLPSGANIFESAKLGNTEALKRYLAKDDSDVNAQDNNGITLLSWAALTGQVNTAELLLSEGANVNGKNRDGSSALHSAAFLGRVQVVELLIRNEAEINGTNNMGETPLGSVALEWNDEIEGITRFIASILKIDVDLDQVKAARPKVAELLRKYGGQTGDNLK